MIRKLGCACGGSCCSSHLGDADVPATDPGGDAGNALLMILAVSAGGLLLAAAAAGKLGRQR
jgi:hypothetical protein